MLSLKSFLKNLNPLFSSKAVFSGPENFSAEMPSGASGTGRRRRRCRRRRRRRRRSRLPRRHGPVDDQSSPNAASDVNRLEFD